MIILHSVSFQTNSRKQNVTMTTTSMEYPTWSPGACFSKVPKLFGRISGDIILFVSSKRRRLEARNFAVILIFIPFTTYEKTSFTEKAGRSFTNGFSGPKSSRDFRETGPWTRQEYQCSSSSYSKESVCVTK